MPVPMFIPHEKGMLIPFSPKYDPNHPNPNPHLIKNYFICLDKSKPLPEVGSWITLDAKNVIIKDVDGRTVAWVPAMNWRPWGGKGNQKILFYAWAEANKAVDKPELGIYECPFKGIFGKRVSESVVGLWKAAGRTDGKGHRINLKNLKKEKPQLAFRCVGIIAEPIQKGLQAGKLRVILC